MNYEKLMNQYPQITFFEKRMPKGLPGLYYDNVVEIDKYLTYREKNEVLAEELGHYEKSYGDITDYSCVKSKKQEELARRWAIEKIVSLEKLIECYHLKLTNIEEVCFYLEITPKYFYRAIKYYRIKHGRFYTYKGYWFSFSPLFISKLTTT